MRLSEAILIGDVLRERSFYQWLSTDNKCGCALGGAYLAVGKLQADLPTDADGCINESIVFQDVWPWLNEKNVSVISDMFRLVCGHKAYADCPEVETLEDLCDVVRRWEDALAARGINIEQAETVHQGTTISDIESAVVKVEAAYART